MMWGSGLTHGLWMVVGWFLGLLAVAIAVYVGVQLATRQMIGKLIHLPGSDLYFEHFCRNSEAAIARYVRILDWFGFAKTWGLPCFLPHGTRPLALWAEA